jgi:hypothetical protein
MAQWGRNDQSVTVTSGTTKETSNGAPIGTYALVKAGGGDTAHQGNTNGTRANTDKNMFGNTTQDAFITGKAVGVFGVDPAEATGAVGGPVAEGYITFGGSGYGSNTANLTVTVTNGGTGAIVNAVATGGKITSFAIGNSGGSGYITNPTVTITAPQTIAVNGNTAVSNDTITLSSANSYFLVNDGITISSNASSLPGGLTNGSRYYVVLANTSAFKLSATKGGTPIAMTDASGDNTTAGGLGLVGDTATGYLVSGGNKGTGIAHAGWVLRTEGSGGRAGRVQFETLVAMGSLGAQSAPYGTPATTADAADDTFLPES